MRWHLFGAPGLELRFGVGVVIGIRKILIHVFLWDGDVSGCDLGTGSFLFLLVLSAILGARA
jgi:hypothetical protein